MRSFTQVFGGYVQCKEPTEGPLFLVAGDRPFKALVSVLWVQVLVGRIDRCTIYPYALPASRTGHIRLAMDDKLTKKKERAKRLEESWKKALASCKDEAPVKKLKKMAEDMRRGSIYAKAYTRAWIDLGLGPYQKN